jgi:OOP family OmpA-OmpF porin
MLYSRTLLGVALAALGAGAALAADDAPAPAGEVERDYVFDISGSPARTGLTGDCVYTRVYSAEGVRPTCLNEAAAQETAPAVAASPGREDSAAQAGAMSPTAERDREAERAASEEAAARAAAQDEAARVAAEAAAARAAEDAAARAAAEDQARRAAAEAAAAERAREATPAVPPAPAELARPEEALPAPTRPAVTDRTPVIKTVSLDTRTLFEFDRSVLTPAGRKELDAFVAELAGLEYGTIHVTGHADRIGSKAYNVALSHHRAEAVKRYLAERGTDAHKIEARGVGSSVPATQAGACDGLKGASLIDCLHPDRRVEVEVTAQREE